MCIRDSYFVADQPCMRGETIAEFVRGFLKSGKGIGCVCAKGHRGSPNLFAGKYKKELLALEGDQGGRQIMQEHPEDIWMMEVDERELSCLLYTSHFSVCDPPSGGSFGSCL